MPNMIYSPERDAQIADMFVHQGLTAAEIARRLHSRDDTQRVSAVRVGQILHDLHIDTRRILRERSRQRMQQRAAQRDPVVIVSKLRSGVNVHGFGIRALVNPEDYVTYYWDAKESMFTPPTR